MFVPYFVSYVSSLQTIEIDAPTFFKTNGIRDELIKMVQP
jgi:hypothetical protein